MCAAEGDWATIVRRLLKAGARTDLRNFDGTTALDYAQHKGHHAIAKLLSKTKPAIHNCVRPILRHLDSKLFDKTSCVGWRYFRR